MRTATDTWRSPRPAPVGRGSPLPATFSTVPGCVPGRMFTTTWPSKGLIIRVVPKTASGTVTSSRRHRSAPRRTNRGSTAVRTMMYASPARPRGAALGMP